MSRRMDALRALASQSVSPHEAEIARQKLADLAAKDAAAMDPTEPCAECGMFQRDHRPMRANLPDTEFFRRIVGWHAYEPAWQRAWADYREHERIAEAREQAEAAARQEAEIAALVKRWERGTYAGMTLGADAHGPRIGKA